ncbi:MAG: Maf family protein [Solirubrobacteraceae bacterium]
MRRARVRRSRGGAVLPGPARLILASGSPQRRAILEQIGARFEVRVSDVEELTDGPPAELVLENAYRKAAAVAAGLPPRAADGGPCVLGVDTIVTLGARIFGKPRDEAHAAEILAQLAGRSHVVLSGVCLIEPGAPDRTRTAAAQTAVELRALDRAAIDAYVATGEWRGRAGGYAIQGVGATLVTRVEGDYLSVVGLPVATLLDLAPWLAR